MEPKLIDGLTRRAWLTRSAGLLALAAGGAAAARSESAKVAVSAAQKASILRFDNARAEMLALISVLGDLSGVPAPWWYTGYIYGVRPGEEPRKILRFEGCEINRFTRHSDAGFAQTARTITFFSDPRTEEVLEQWRNPYTGIEQAVKPNVLGGRGRMLWTDLGLIPQFGSALEAEAALKLKPQPLEVRWQPYGRWIWVRHDRVYPPGLPQPLGESSTTLVERKWLSGRQRNSLPGHFSSSYLAPWPAWMAMRDQPGHVLWHADGLKLDRVEQLPAAFLARARRLYPQQLEVPAG
jgi:hypothetical protein